MTINKTVVKAGKDYKVTMNGAGDVSLKYQVVLAAPLAADELPTEFTDVPKIGTEHPNRKGLYALTYDVSQPADSAKSTLDITVNYGPADITETEVSGEPDTIEAVTEWGWDDGTGEKELVSSLDTPPKAVVNSAGDPFDSVPSVSMPTPTFTKVMRRNKRQSDYTQYFCTTNSASLTIGAMTCAPGTLLCTVAEKKLIGEVLMPYEYTVHLKYRSNKVDVGGTETEIGWDVAIVDAGMRELDATTGQPKLITVLSKETNKPATVTSPALLDGNGHALNTLSSQQDPVILTFQAYKRETFPNWFYSEPPTPGTVTPSSNTNTNNNNGNGGE